MKLETSALTPASPGLPDMPSVLLAPSEEFSGYPMNLNKHTGTLFPLSSTDKIQSKVNIPSVLSECIPMDSNECTDTSHSCVQRIRVK